MKKSDVNGDHANDVYKYLKEQKSGILGLSRIKVKILVVPTVARLPILIIICTSAVEL